MKTIKLLSLSVCFFLCTNCKNENKETVTTNKNKVETTQKPEHQPKITNSEDHTVVFSKFKPSKQKNNSIPSNESNSYKKPYLLKDGDCNFKTTSDNIHVEIPVTDKNLYIADVFNVSDYSGGKKYNAIVIVLDGIKGRRTDQDSTTNKIISDFKITEINGLSKNHLKSEKFLKVYILHDDSIDDNDEKKKLKSCASKETDKNSHLECDLTTGILYENNKINGIIKPREQEGDIILGD